MDIDFLYMEYCLELAKKAASNGDVPVGAIVIDSDGEIIGEGYNCRERNASSLAHAELIAIEEASKTLGSWRLSGCTLYVTLEPCAMCAGAAVNSRIERVVFGAYDKRFGACGSCFNLFEQGLNHTPQIIGELMQEECSKILTEFFKRLREKKQVKEEF